MTMGLADRTTCPSCWHDLRAHEIPEENRHLFGGKRYFSRVIGVEYGYDHPEHWDGISEWQCPDCGYREGRFSGRELKEGEHEERPR